MGDRFLRREEAADYLRDKAGVGTTRWLAKLASTGGGPTFYKMGRRPLYKQEDLDRWISEKLSRPYQSTSDYSRSEVAA